MSAGILTGVRLRLFSWLTRRSLQSMLLSSGANSDTLPNNQSVGNEYIFIFDITNGVPVQTQIVQLANTFVGIIFAPDGQTLYVGGGQDDSIHSFQKQGGLWTEVGTPIALGYTTANGLYPGDYPPMTGGLDITQDGTILAVANYSNDSISFISLANRTVLASYDLRPGIINPAQTGVPGGEYPFWAPEPNRTVEEGCSQGESRFKQLTRNSHGLLRGSG
jgi:hypothetical protein